jgi:hypothetical protein
MRTGRPIPMFSQYTIGDADDVSRDPTARGESMPRKAAWTITNSL